MSGPAGVRFERRFHVALHYQVLSQLNLGRDAASLWTGGREASGRPRLPWVARLERAYAAADGRLSVQALPLLVDDIADLFVRLGPGRPGSLRDPAGRELASALTHALESSAASFWEAWEAATAGAEARLGEVATALSGPLTKLRGALWARAERRFPPELVVLDAPALGPHGRGAAHRDRHVVAVSLAQPLDHLLCQVFHEEVHAVSDVELPAADRPRDTQLGAAGHATHRRIEAHAVRVGRDLVAQAAPEHNAAYARWCAGFDAS